MLSAMGNTLIAYYSWTGHTRDIADAIAAALGSDVEQIREVRPRAGPIAYIRSVWEALRGRAASLEPLERDPSRYDLTVLGTPVWAGRMSSPMRSYILQQRGKLGRIALFCSEGGANGDEALAQMAKLCGKAPVATLIVMERDLSSGAFRQKVADFTKALK